MLGEILNSRKTTKTDITKKEDKREFLQLCENDLFNLMVV